MTARAGGAAPGGAADWQRLDMWLWCARVAKARADCARLVEAGGIRLNRQPVAKAHTRLRIGDVLTMALRGEVRVWRVTALAPRRGPASEARLLYEDVPEAAPTPNPCAKAAPAAYRGAGEPAPGGGDRGDRHQER